MPEVLDWRRVAEPYAVIHYAVQSLRRGRTVAFPTETGYVLAAGGLATEAVRQLGEEPPTLALRAAAEAREWAPGMSPLARRLAGRVWPGPVTLLVGGVEQGLVSRLSEEVRGRLCPDGVLRLATPGHETLREVLRRLPGPLLLAELPGEATAVGAEEIVRQAGERVDVVLDDGPRPGSLSPTLVSVNGYSWQVVRPGVVSVEQIRQRLACLVLFLCTGNTCRSPLAEALCKKRLADQLGCTVAELPARGFHVMSAGVSASLGGPAAVEAVEVARSYEADLSAHRSRPLTAELAARADYLLGMTQGHLLALTEMFPQHGSRPRLLDPAGDIADPIGCDRPIYEQCARQIWHNLEALVSEIVKGGLGERPA